MSLQAGLSFDQAPPILVPFRFFLSAPLFALLAALLALWFGPGLLDNRWQPSALALTHLMTLGFLGMAMLGAMMQLLPVMAGSPVTRPVAVARAVHLLLIPGILALVLGFLLARQWPVRVAMVLLGGGFLVFILAIGLSLKRASSSSPIVVSMRLAIVGLLVTLLLGLTLASNYGWGWWLTSRVALTNLHLTWGLLGWVGLLVIGVAYQVVPMFQLTPSYPRAVTRLLTPALFCVLLLWSGSLFLPEYARDKAGLGLGLLAAAGYAAFAVTTLRLQLQRRRKQPDVTLLFWRFAMICLLLALLTGLAGQVAPALMASQADNYVMMFLFIGGFTVSAVNGMLYKIVPFLIWFHLQSRLMGVAKVPNMRQIMPEAPMRRQMWLQFAAVALLCPAPLWPLLIYPAALLFGASMLWLEWNLISAYNVYRRNIKLVS